MNTNTYFSKYSTVLHWDRLRTLIFVVERNQFVHQTFNANLWEADSALF